VPIVIREGRAALVTSFGVFKYMAGYSLTQFTTVLLLYWLATNLTDFQFLYIDLFLITTFAIFFGYTDAAEQLAPQPPPTRLLSVSSVASIIGLLIIIGLFQAFTFVFVTTQPWFVPYSIPAGDDDETKVSMQGTAVFYVSIYQYIALAIVYSTGFPYRKPIFNNRMMCVSVVVLSAICVYITLAPPPFVVDFLELDPVPYLGFRLLLLTIALLSGVLCYLYETWVIDYLLMTVRERWKKQRKALSDRDSVKYERILRMIGGEPTWLRSFIEKMDAADRTPSPPENLLRASSVSPEDCCLIESDQKGISNGNGHHRPSKDMTSSL
jgi:cation-transporting ATPase 13A2